MRKLLKAYAVLFGFGGLVLLLDQLSKRYIETHLAFGQTVPIWHGIPNVPVMLVHWSNSGMAFGLGERWGIFFTALGIAYAVGMVVIFPRLGDEWWLRFALAIQWGGALGNVVDRLRQGHVTDFIAVGKFPVFNLADAAINISVAILILGEIFGRKGGETGEEGTLSPEEALPEAPKVSPHE